MDTSAFFIIFLVLLLDSITAVIGAWLSPRWWTQHLRVFSRWFPPAKGWTLYYLVLVLFIGCILRFYGGFGF